MPRKMNLKEFQDLGYLQEVNRRFFHPLGLALAVYWDEDDLENKKGVEEGSEPIGLYIYDDRDDANGSWFGSLADSDSAGKYMHIEAQLDKYQKNRKEKFGWVIQPIGHYFEDE